MHFNIIHCNRMFSNVTSMIIAVSFSIMRKSILLLAISLLSLILCVRAVWSASIWIPSLHTTTAAEIKEKVLFQNKRNWLTPLELWKKKARMALLRYNTTFIIILLHYVINSNRFGLNEKCWGLKHRYISVHTSRTSHYYHSKKPFKE
jgi:hypothetical protein